MVMKATHGRNSDRLWQRHLSILGLMLTTLGVWGGSCANRSTATIPTPPPTFETARVASDRDDPIRDTHERLHGVLWMQTAAEYWALAASAYREAQNTLLLAIKDKSWTAATEQTTGYENLPVAVILDLDETVLDNSPLQAQLVLDRSDYLPATWDAWVDRMEANIIPGAKEFIAFAMREKVGLFFITNRTAAEQEETLKNLAKAGIPASDENILCTGENGWPSDKTSRRQVVAKTHRILLLIGDDMNDFISTAKLKPEERLALAMKHSNRWGSSWVLIPNPLYGSWERAIYPGLTQDPEILLKKRQVARGFRQ